jgi:hypothetical protein
MDIAAYVEALRRPEIVLGFVLAIASLALWQIPIIGWPFYPFYLFGLFIHELSHALAVLLTGGKLHRVVILPGRSGFAEYNGGVGCIIGSAGYVGSALFGGLLLIIAAGDIPAASVLMWLGILLMLASLLFVRNVFGIVAGIFIGAGLIAASLRLAEFVTEALLWLLAIQFILYAFASFGNLFDWTQYPEGFSDAHILAKDTGIPPLVWALLWSLIALAILFIALSWAFNLPMPWELRFSS